MVASHDVRHGLRSLLGSPGFALVGIGTLALGIGATSMVYSVVTAIFAASSPPSQLEREVGVWTYQRAGGVDKGVASPRDFVEWKRRARAFDLMAAWRPVEFNLAGLDRPVRVSGQMASADYMDVLEYRLAAGRPIVADDERPGAPAAVWLGHRFWLERLAGATDVIGRSIALDGEQATIAGVLAPRPLQPDIVVPLRPDPADSEFETRALFVFARLRDDVTVDEARVEMARIAAVLEREFPETHGGWGVSTRPLAEEFIGPKTRVGFGMLLGAVTVVLLIGCANIANLLVARGLVRQRELAVRSALGATRGRLFRQVLVESAWLAVAGGVLGAALAYGGVAWLRTALPDVGEAIGAASIGWRVLLLATLFSSLATLGFGLVPALRGSRPDLEALLREGSPRSSAGGRTQRLRHALVTGEVFLSVTLLVVAALLVRTLMALQHIEPGFDTSGVLTSRVTLPESQYSDDEAVSDLFERAIARIRQDSMVLHASAGSRVPAAGSNFNPNRSLVIDGRPVEPDESLSAVELTIMPDYFRALGITLREGRDFAAHDRAGAPLAAVVSRAAARKYFGDRSPIGARLRLGDEPSPEAWRTVVGVVADVRNDDIDAPPLPHVYVPLAQQPQRTMTIVVRTEGNPASVASAVRAAVAAEDAGLPLYDVQTMEQIVRQDLAGTRVLVQVLALFSVSALLLAAAGIGGVLAQTVSQRVPEIGIRLALGATAGAVVGLVLRQAAASVLAGLALGLAAAFLVARLVAGVLYQVTPSDPGTYIGVAVVLFGSAMAAAVMPVLRAVRVDPLVALRG